MVEPHAFPSTRWSLVLAAGAKRDVDENAQAALNELCLAYWKPLYAYACRRVSSIHEAQDLTQEFFANLLQKESLSTADRQRGKFRTFLLTSFQHFIINQWEKRRALKRGGNVHVLSLDREATQGLCPRCLMRNIASTQLEPCTANKNQRRCRRLPPR